MPVTIGVMDSGAGGLSILTSIRAALPAANLIYFADQAFAPYGDLTPDIIQQRLARIGHFFSEQGCQMMVVACNTATVAAIASLRAQLSIPIVGVEPAVKPACSASRRKRVTVLATPTTAGSVRLLDLIDTWRAESEVTVMASQSLASLIDQMPQSEYALEAEVKRICEAVQAQESDALVLACTHYPLIGERFAAYLPNVSIVEPSRGVTAQVLRLLQRHNLCDEALNGEKGTLILQSSGQQAAINSLQFWAQALTSSIEPITLTS